MPLEFLFSGSVFYTGEGALQAERISWESEAAYRLPVAVWKETMERHFRGTAWVRLSQGVASTGWPPTTSRNALATLGRRAGRAAGRLSVDAVARIADAVLYEGYMLWPYRALGAEEPAPLDVRRRLPARVDRRAPGRRVP